MAHHKSAKKRIRRNEAARVRNRQGISAVRTAVKAFRVAVTGVLDGTVDKAKLVPLFQDAQSLLARAAKKGLLHKNNVERRIGRLALTLNRVSSTETQAAAAASVTQQKQGGAKKKTAAVRKKAAAAKKTATKKKTTSKKA